MKIRYLAILLAVCWVSAPLATLADDTVNLYSARNEALIAPLLERFTEETGIQVRLLTARADALLQRLQSEGINSPADVLLNVDAGNLHRAKEAGLIRPLDSATLRAAVPETYRDPEGHWVGLSMRARPIMYVKDKIDPDQLSSYEQLTDPAWRGKICIRSSDNIYNQSMVASMIAEHGEDATEAWVMGLVANMARPPRGGDRDQIKAAAAGQCDLAIANTYYLAGMLTDNDPAERQPAQAIGVFWPNQEDRGVHVNVSGAALTQSAKNEAAAIRLIEFLVSPESQAWYAEVNGEYPVREGTPISSVLEQWGTFKADSLNLAQLGELNAAAVRLMDRAGWR